MAGMIKDGETILFYGFSNLLKSMVSYLHSKKKVRPFV